MESITERQCSVALVFKKEREKERGKKKISPHCMKDLDVIQTFYQETGQIKSNHKLEYRLKKKKIKLHGSKLNLRQESIFSLI